MPTPRLFRAPDFAALCTGGDTAHAVSITDAHGTIRWVNERFCKLAGMTPPQLLGHDHRLLNSGYHPKSHMRAMWRTIQNGTIWCGALRNQRGDGTRYWLDATIVPHRRDDGAVAYAMIARETGGEVATFAEPSVLPCHGIELGAVFEELAEHSLRDQEQGSWTLMPHLPCRVWADSTALRYAFTKVLAARKGSVLEPTLVRVGQRGGRCVITFCNRPRRGPRHDLVARLWEPVFSRGMGPLEVSLFVARRIIEAHGGRLDARQSAGGRVEVRIVLPLDKRLQRGSVAAL